MAIPSIGSYSFVGWKGQLVLGPLRRTRFEQGGTAGYGYLFGALKTDEQTIQTVYRASSSGDAATNYTGYRALCEPTPTAVTVVDQFGVTWNGVLVCSVVPEFAFDPIGWLVLATWTLLPQSA